MPEVFDCIVMGVGGFGSSVLYHVARRGLNVCGIDRFGIAHDRGSSHGESRVIRRAYFEHPNYIPLVDEAFELWRQLESETGRTLYRQCGLLLGGPPDGEVAAGTRLAATQYGVRMEDVPITDCSTRFRGHRIPDGFDVIHEPQGGLLYVEDCVRAHVECAIAQGATLRTGEVVREWSSAGNMITVRTDQSEFQAASLVCAIGAWTPGVAACGELELKVLRKPQFWFSVRNAEYNVENAGRIFLYEMPYGTLYGFPSLDGQTVKIAEHSGGEVVNDPSALNREINARDVDPVARFVREVMPGLDPAPVRSSVCMYTMSNDGHFIVDRHPACSNVVVAAGFSGHGFKFTSCIGRAIAEMIVDGQTESPVAFLGLDRDSL